MGDLVPFPKPIIELTEEEYEKFEAYKEKMKQARNRAEMKYYHSQAKLLMEKAQERQNQSRKS